MILTDYSSILHRMLYTAVSSVKPTVDENEKYITSEYIDFCKFLMMEELINIERQFASEYGDLIICLDDHSKGYWRKEVYSGYKQDRAKNRSKTQVNFPEVFEEVNKLSHELINNSPWRVLNIPRAEADDTMLVLAREFCKSEKVLIHSPDKDMIQAQRYTDNVRQYSSLTKKFLGFGTKAGSMEEWVNEHICLGDAADAVPKITDRTEFSEEFNDFLNTYNDVNTTLTELDFHNLDRSGQESILNMFEHYKDSKYEGIPSHDIPMWKKIRLGPKGLQKKLKEAGSLENFLAENELYRRNAEMNFVLVMEEGIPQDIRKDIIDSYVSANVDFDPRKFETYLEESGLGRLVSELPKSLKVNELTAEDFNW